MKNLFALAICLLGVLNAFSQTKTISGDSEETIINIQKTCILKVETRNFDDNVPLEKTSVTIRDTETFNENKGDFTTDDDGFIFIELVHNMDYQLGIFKEKFGLELRDISTKGNTCNSFQDTIVLVVSLVKSQIFAPSVEILSPLTNTIVQYPIIELTYQVVDKSDNFKKVKISHKVEQQYPKRGDLVETGDASDGLIRKTIQIRLYKGLNEISIMAMGKNGENSKKVTTKITYEPIPFKYYALLIGMQEYDDRKIKDLKYPIEDAQNLKNVLVSDYTFDEENVKILENPTRGELLKSLRVLEGEINSNQPDSICLLIFYAGHGYYDTTSNIGYLKVKNSKKDIIDSDTWVSNDDIKNFFKSIKSKHTLLISDSCFSGSLLAEGRSSNYSVIAEKYQKAMGKKSRKIMTSGSLDEQVDDDSFFIQRLIQELERNTDPQISAQQLYNRFYLEIPNQSPQYEPLKDRDVGHEQGGEFIFVKRR